MNGMGISREINDFPYFRGPFLRQLTKILGLGYGVTTFRYVLKIGTHRGGHSTISSIIDEDLRRASRILDSPNCERG